MLDIYILYCCCQCLLHGVPCRCCVPSKKNRDNGGEQIRRVYQLYYYTLLGKPALHVHILASVELVVHSTDAVGCIRPAPPLMPVHLNGQTLTSSRQRVDVAVVQDVHSLVSKLSLIERTLLHPTDDADSPDTAATHPRFPLLYPPLDSISKE